MTLLSRIAGFVRDMVQASLFGAGGDRDAFVVAYRIPNYLRRIFAEGSFASAFVPVLSELRQKSDPAALKDFLDHVAGALCAAVLVVSGLGMLAAPLVVGADRAGQPGRPGEVRADLADAAHRLSVSGVHFDDGAGRCGAQQLPALRAAGRSPRCCTTWPSSPRCCGWRRCFDGAASGAGLGRAGRRRPAAVAAMAGAGTARPAARDCGSSCNHPGVRRVFTLMLPTLFSSSVAQLNLIVGTVFASLLVDGSQTLAVLLRSAGRVPAGPVRRGAGHGDPAAPVAPLRRRR